MSNRKLWKRMRGINDTQLSVVLDNHAGNLRGMSNALTVVLRERRLLFVWWALVTLVTVWACIVLNLFHLMPWDILR